MPVSFITSNVYNVNNDETKSNGTELSSQQDILRQATPKQPLPSIGDHLSEEDLWRILSAAAKELASAVSGNGKESSEAKKNLIDVQKEAQIKQLNEQLEQKIKQAESEKSKSFWSKISMALGIVAALIMLPFNPVMAAIMVGTMVAAMVVPKIIDAILKASGVDEKIRQWVSMAVEIAVAIVGTILSFNPGNIATSITKVTVNTAAKIATTLEKVMASLKSFKGLGTLVQKAENLISKVMKLIQPLVTKLQEFAKGGQLAIARVNQASSTISNASSVVATGYSINSAAITKELEVYQAEQEELETRLQQLQAMLDTVLKAMSQTFESLFDVKDAERKFHQNMIKLTMQG